MKKIKRELTKFFLDVVVSSNTASAKRATTLVMLGYLMLYCTVTTIAFIGVIFWSTKGDLEKIKILSNLFEVIVDQSTLIILFGLGGITSVDIAAILKAKHMKGNNRGWGGNWGGNDGFGYNLNDDDDSDITKIPKNETE